MSLAFAWGSAEFSLIVTSTEPSLFVVTANAGVLLAGPRASMSAVPAPASPSVMPARTPGRRRRGARPGSGRWASASVGPCSRTRSRHRLSVNLVIALVFLSQPGPRPGQPLSECDTGDAEGCRRLLRGEPLQVDELDRRPLDRGQLRASPHERGALALSIDPLGELLDLVLVKRPVAAETRDRVPAARRLLAVAGEHASGDAEQPRPVRSPARVEPDKAIHSPDERLGGEIGDRMRIAAPAREVAHEDVDVAQVHLLEFLKRQVWRPPARPRPHRDRSLPRRPHECSCLSAHVP